MPYNGSMTQPHPDAIPVLWTRRSFAQAAADGFTRQWLPWVTFFAGFLFGIWCVWERIVRR